MIIYRWTITMPDSDGVVGMAEYDPDTPLPRVGEDVLLPAPDGVQRGEVTRVTHRLTDDLRVESTTVFLLPRNTVKKSWREDV